MEIEYIYFTVDQCKEFLLKNDPSSELGEALTKALESANNTISGDLIAILALSDGIVAGRMFMTYGHISTPEKKIRVALGQAFYTKPEFRGRGIGTVLTSKYFEITSPKLRSGTSNQGLRVLKKFPHSFIDQSPIYQMPVGSKGILREWRNRMGRISKPKQDLFHPIRVLNKTRKTRATAIKKSSTSDFVILKSDMAISTTTELMKVRYRHFQVPWDKSSMTKAASGDVSKFRLVVFEKTVENVKTAHFVTIYKKVEHVRVPGTSRQLDLLNGLVNEIYPPPETLETAIEILGILTTKSKDWGFDNLAFCAMTPILVDACQSMGLNTYHCKRVGFEPGEMEDTMAKSIVLEENWWCRAVTEDFVEEAG